MNFGPEVLSLWLIVSVALGQWLWCDSKAEAPSPRPSVKNECPASPL